MDVVEFITARRDGKSHTEAGLVSFAKEVASGQIPDYQISAWLMAAYLNPLSQQETGWLTKGMADSGARLDLAPLPKPWVDKHSTGGVGDKTTLVLLPLLAACGLTVVKMSGRGLGITGGTVDKLESIPGFKVSLSLPEMLSQAKAIGIAFSGQTPDLAPADKVLYALRDTTGTVESIPLIVSSILSKKIAGGADTICLDVKCGAGAFMKDLASARELATALVSVGNQCGIRVTATITDMNQPLGHAVGNRLEVIEAVMVMHEPKGRFAELCKDFAAEVLVTCGDQPTEQAAKARIEKAFESGAVLDKARAWFHAQGADPNLIDNPNLWDYSTHRVEVRAPKSAGYVEGIDAGKVGQLALDMGAGRHAKGDTVRPEVGIWIHRHVGDEAEGVLAELHLSPDETRVTEFEARLLEAYSYSSDRPTVGPLILESI